MAYYLCKLNSSEIIIKNCEFCKKRFQVLDTKNGRGRRFCSVKCSSRWKAFQPEWRKLIRDANIGKKRSKESRQKQRKTMLEGIASGKIKLSVNTLNISIEIAMENELIKTKLRFEKQKYIKNVGIVDFFLSDYNIIIECDGDYFHNRPRAHQNDVDRDFVSMFSYGYKTIRFWQHEIDGSPKKCMRKILKEMVI